MRKTRIIILAAAFTIAVAAVTVAFAASDHELQREAVTSGGGMSNSTSYTLHGALGQPASGSSENANQSLHASFVRPCVVQLPTPTASATPTPTATPTSRYHKSTYPYGDANMDGVVGLGDHADVKAMLLLTKDHNSAADIDMDGKIGLADHADVKAMLLLTKSPSDRYTASYDFNTSGAGTLDLAASKQVLSMPAVTWPADVGWTNFSAGDYNDVEAIDADDFSMAANVTAKNVVQCRFTVFEQICATNLTHIEVNVTASSQSMSEALQYWAWNFNSVQWDQVDDSMPMSNGEDSYYRVTDWGPPNIDDYINGNGHMYLMVMLADNNRALNIDYIQVVFVGPEM
jgi:hypothetical protein